jgi:hypothetical protein
MSEIRVNKLIDEAGTGAVELTQGATIPSAKTISGAGAISVTGNVASSGQISGATGSFTGNVSIGGTLTYEDVTNVDSVGIVTAQTGIKVLAGGADIVGVTTTKGGLNTEDILAEEVNVVTSSKLSDAPNISVEDGMVHLFTTADSTTSTPNIRYNGSTALNARMSIGQSIVVTLITTANASAYSAQMTIDGVAQTERWIGGTAPSDGGSAGVDIHTFTIIKTADATFTVIGNHSKTS